MNTDSATADSLYKLCPRCQHIYPPGTSFCGRDQAALIADDRILAGKYILVRKIGEGNMGAVYEAEQPQIGRKVAVKVLRPDPEVMLRFEREVHASGALNHAHVVTIYDSGLTEDGRGYIAMEYLEGQSLARYLEQHGPLPPVLALELWVQAVRGISAAHSKGIVHRDLKPDNLFIARRHSDEGPETVVKVLDFGIAKFHRQAPAARGTTPGMIVGTMQYMAPEQLEGAEANPAVDVYALGLILVEMLTGRLPWGQTQELSLTQFTLRLVVPPTPLAQLRPEQTFSAELQKLVQDMLALEPTARPANGGELFHRLKNLPEAPSTLRAESGAGGGRASSSALSPAPMSMRRDLEGVRTSVVPAAGGRAAARSRWALALGLGLLVSAGLAGVYVLSHRTPSPAVVSTRAADPGSAGAVQPTPGSRPAPVDKLVEPAGGTTKAAVHHPAHATLSLKVQLAFTDGKGVTLTCSGKKQPPPDCSAGGLCKSVVLVSAGQKCTAEKGRDKKIFTYAELQKNQPDRRNLIHVLVRFP